MADFSSIIAAARGARSSSEGAEAMLLQLAERIKATSNDQNVQKLARDLTAAASDIAKAFGMPADLGIAGDARG